MDEKRWQTGIGVRAWRLPLLIFLMTHFDLFYLLSVIPVGYTPPLS